MMEKVESEADVRNAFEKKAFNRYFVSSVIVSDNPTHLFRLVSTAQKTKAEFCSRDSNGHYVDDALEQAWWGWKHGFKTAIERSL